MKFLRSILDTVSDLIAPPHCCACGIPIEAGAWCEACREGLPYIRAPRCEQCSLPFSGAIGGEFICPNCQEHTFHFRSAVAAVMSRGIIRDLIHGLKYHGKSWNARTLVQIAKIGLDDERLDKRNAILVPVPLHPFRKRDRGYNQSELLARAMSQASGVPVVPLLRRTRATVTQTHFDRAQRLKNLRGAFALEKRTVPEDARIVLVDDVFTTGATLDECARTLVEQGFSPPDAFVIARA